MEMKKISREEILEKKVELLQNYTQELQKRIFQLEKIVKNNKQVEKKTTLTTKEVREVKEVKNPKDNKKPA